MIDLQSRRSILALITAAMIVAGASLDSRSFLVAQDTEAPAPPSDGPGDPPLLPTGDPQRLAPQEDLPSNADLFNSSNVISGQPGDPPSLTPPLGDPPQADLLSSSNVLDDPPPLNETSVKSAGDPPPLTANSEQSSEADGATAELPSVAFMGRAKGGSSPLLTSANSNVLTDIPPDDVTSQPELIVDAGGFLGPVVDVAISPDSRLIAASGDKVVRIIDAATGDPVATLRGDRARTSYGNTNGVAFSPDGQFLLVGVHDDRDHGSIRIYKTNDFSRIDSLLAGQTQPCSHVEFSPDGQFLVTADGDGQIYVWDWPQQTVVRKIAPRNPDKPIIDAMQFAEQEPYLATVEHDGPHIYRLSDGQEISGRDYMPPRLLGWVFDILQQKVAWPFTMTKSPRTFEGRLVNNLWAAAGIGKDGGQSRPWVGIWNARNMSPQTPPNSYAARTVYTGHRWEVYTVALSADQTFAVSGDKFGEVHIWDANTGEARHTVTSQGKPIYQAAFSTTNEQIVFGTDVDLPNWGFNSYGLSTHVLDLKQRVIHRRNAKNISVVDEVTQSNGGTARLLAPAAGSQSYRVAWKKNGPETTYRIPSGRVPSCYTLLNGEKLGVADPVLWSDDQGFLAMWNTSTDELRRAYRGHNSMVTSVSPSTNGKVFVTGSTDRTIRLWSLLNHKPTGIFDFKYENSAVIQVTPGSSSAQAGVQVGDRIVSFDGHTLDDVYQMMLYNRFEYQPNQVVPVVLKRGDREFSYQMQLKDGFDYVEPLLNVFIGDNDQWIIWTPQGYYDCSPGADQLIGWHVNEGPDKAAKFFRVQQFRKQLYRPDIIDQVIATGDVREARRIADQQRKQSPPVLDLKDRNSFARLQPPTVSITSPSADTPVDDPRIDLSATVSSAGGQPITQVTLLHNGTPAKVFRPAGSDQATNFSISHRMRLFPGRNEVALIAANRSATSSADDARVILEAQAAEKKAKVYVLAIGIADYLKAGEGVDALKFSADDAREFVGAVQKHSDGRLYSRVEANLLLNADASRAGIMDGLQWLVDNVQQGDVVMFFCSGHGFLDDNSNFYLGSHEVDPARLRSTAVSWRDVISVLHEELPACKRLVFLDACHSAGIGNSAAQNPLHDLAAPELGTIFYASCTVQQKSFEQDDWRHGAFTKSILDILADKSADVSPKTGDGLVNTTELALGVKDRVSTMTGDRQNPVVYAPDQLNRLNVLEFQD